MQYEAMSCFATSTRGSVLLYTTEETQSARHEIDRNAPPRVVFLLHVTEAKGIKKIDHKAPPPVLFLTYVSIRNNRMNLKVVEVGGVVPGYELPLSFAETEYR